jgi:hypothetical protein
MGRKVDEVAAVGRLSFTALAEEMLPVLETGLSAQPRHGCDVKASQRRESSEHDLTTLLRLALLFLALPPSISPCSANDQDNHSSEHDSLM